jgi:hypothetical protein
MRAATVSVVPDQIRRLSGATGLMRMQLMSGHSLEGIAAMRTARASYMTAPTKGDSL